MQRAPAQRTWLAVALICIAALAAYANSFSVPFVFDDAEAVLHNPTIRHLWPLMAVLSPPGDIGQTSGGRPLVNLSFAVDWAVSGEAVWSYHASNLLIHVSAALLLFGLVRRTLARLGPGSAVGAAASPLALVVALLWTVHPLQTESVTYVAQRAESLVSLCYLLTLYCFVRGIDADSPAWLTGAVGACLLGMATKEVMVTAPVLLLLYDRTFAAGSVREALRRRGTWYGALAATWLLLASLTLAGHGRGGTVGFTRGVTVAGYGLTQCAAVVHYVRLALWPDPLVFDYGTRLATGLAAVWPQAVLLAAALGATGWALVRGHAPAFLAAAFFVVLAPSSSVAPVATQVIAEHRMYLPLAAVLGLVVLALHRIVGRRTLAVGVALAVVLTVLTVRRNQVYRSELSLWRDTVAKRPENGRAHYNLANELAHSGHAEEALPHYAEALRLGHDPANVHNNFANALAQAGRFDDAVPEYEAAIASEAGSPEARNNLGNVLVRLGRPEEALSHYEAALAIRPEFPDAHFNAGLVLDRMGRQAEAIAHYERAVGAEPGFVEARYALGTALARSGRRAEARQQFEEIVRLRPDDPQARATLASLRGMDAASP